MNYSNLIGSKIKSLKGINQYHGAMTIPQASSPTPRSLYPTQDSNFI